jgi:hypothetical protein
LPPILLAGARGYAIFFSAWSTSSVWPFYLDLGEHAADDARPVDYERRALDARAVINGKVRHRARTAACRLNRSGIAS